MRNAVLPSVPPKLYNFDYQVTSSKWNYNTQQSLIISGELDLQSTIRRKGSIQVVSSENRLAALSEWKKNKKRKGSSSEEQWLDHILKQSTNIKEYKFQVPVRRSQKLSDKITALQKLVSPYGKTDTASVLQEASLYIKLLQEQIKNLLQMLSSSCPFQETDGRLLDLQSRGLCLIPISVLQKLSQEHCFDTCNQYSIKPIFN